MASCCLPRAGHPLQQVLRGGPRLAPYLAPDLRRQWQLPQGQERPDLRRQGTPEGLGWKDGYCHRCCCGFLSAVPAPPACLPGQAPGQTAAPPQHAPRARYPISRHHGLHCHAAPLCPRQGCLAAMTLPAVLQHLLLAAPAAAPAAALRPLRSSSWSLLRWRWRGGGPAPAARVCGSSGGAVQSPRSSSCRCWAGRGASPPKSPDLG